MSARVHVLGLLEALARGPEAWPGDESAPFAGWAWHRALADTATGRELARQRVLVDEQGRVLLPAARGRTRLKRVVPVRTIGWAGGDLGCPDHLAPAGEVGQAEGLASALAKLRWDAVVLDNIAQEAPTADALAAALAARGCRVRWTRGQVCPWQALPETWDEYLAGFSARHRAAVRRKERRLKRDHEVELVRHAGPTLDAGWSTLLDLTTSAGRARAAGRSSATAFVASTTATCSSPLICGRTLSGSSR